MAIPINAIRLRSEGDTLIVSFEYDGKLYEAFRAGRFGPIDHCITSAGMNYTICKQKFDVGHYQGENNGTQEA